jgi:hypothetical protein
LQNFTKLHKNNFKHYPRQPYLDYRRLVKFSLVFPGGVLGKFSFKKTLLAKRSAIGICHYNFNEFIFNHFWKVSLNVLIFINIISGKKNIEKRPFYSRRKGRTVWKRFVVWGSRMKIWGCRQWDPDLNAKGNFRLLLDKSEYWKTCGTCTGP